MGKSTWVELADVQAELANSISMIYVIADGITTFTKHSAMSGKSAERYASAMQLAYDRLNEVSEKFQEILDSVDLDEQEDAKQEAIA
ncbi:MAG: hypothetical protein HDT20_03845 [Oscillibacter sp.]|nr:hypothetical protein [Oscillibacter sp.]